MNFNKKRFFKDFFIVILTTWSIISIYLIFYIMGTDQIFTKIRITRILNDTTRNKYLNPVLKVKGRLIAASKNKLNLTKIKSMLEKEARSKLKKLFRERPYIVVEQFPSYTKLKCYEGVRVNFYVKESLHPRVSIADAYEQVKEFLDKKLNTIFAAEDNFFESLPIMELKNGQLYFLEPNNNLKLPKSLMVNDYNVLSNPYGNYSHRLFRCYINYWNAEYQYASTQLKGFDMKQSRKKKILLQVPVKNSQGETYQILVRLKY